MDLTEEQKWELLEEEMRRQNNGGAAFGIYPSSGKRPEKLNVSRDVNMPAQAARGWVASTLGLLGDFESLGRMGINFAFGPGGVNVDETPLLPTSEFYQEWLPGRDERPAAQFASGLGALAGGAGSTKLAGAAVKGAKAAGKALGPKAAEMAEGYLLKSGLAPSVVKPKGGNWLSGSVEGATERLKTIQLDERNNLITPESVTPEIAAKNPDLAVNNWIDTKLNKYIRNEMGTPEDPVRKLAERGITHMQNPPAPETRGWVQVYRQEAGYPREGLGQTPLAKSWENIADEAIAAQSAGRLRGALSEFEGAKTTGDIHAGIDRTLVKERARQLEDTFKDTPSKDLADEFNLDYEVTDANRAQAIEDWARMEVEGYYRGNAEDMLGPHYGHKVGLEAYDAGTRGENLGWLSKVPEDQPVYALQASEGQTPEFQHLIDELRNATRADSDLPAHLRWKPEDLKKVTMEQAVERVAKINDWRAAQMAAAQKAAREGIPIHKEYEGGFQWMAAPDTAIDPKSLQYIKDVGCEGGWCTQGEDAARRYGADEGRLYVLHDSSGKPVVQISTKTTKREIPQREIPVEVTSELQQAAEKEARAIGEAQGFSPWSEEVANIAYGKYHDALDKWRAENQQVSTEILEIKGKQNRAPKEEHLPMVQDFVRSGNWSRVGDFRNTGMRDMAQTPNLQKWLESKNIPHSRYVTEQEYAKYEADFLADRLNREGFPGFAKGGLVQDTDTIAAKLVATGMDKDKALTQALRMADAKQEAHMAAGGISRLLKGAKKAGDSAKTAEKAAEAAKPAVKGPRDEALETARKNAVKMLGLPEDNTAMDRARAMGFEPGWAHGSPRNDLTELRSSKTGAEGPGAYATNYRPEASTYSQLESGATVYPLMVRKTNVLDVGKENPYEVLSANNDVELLKALADKGKDSIVKTQEKTPDWLLRAGAPDMPERQHYVSTKPENFRSRFAAFDPARINESDILGAADPALLAGTAVASGVGLGALGQLNKRKPEKEEKKKATGGLAKRV